MARDTTDTPNLGYPRPVVGSTWSDDWDSLVEAIDDDIPHELATGTITASGGSPPAVDTTITGVAAA